MITDETRDVIAANCFAIAEYLLGPAVIKRHGQLRWGNKGSLSVEDSGTFMDFETREHGDMIKLWSIARKVSIGDAIREITDWLGSGTLPVQKEGWVRRSSKPKGIVWPEHLHSAWTNGRDLNMRDLWRWEKRGLPVTLDKDGRVAMNVFPNDMRWFPFTRYLKQWGCIGTIAWKYDNGYLRSSAHRFWNKSQDRKYVAGACAAKTALHLASDRTRSGVALVGEGIENSIAASVYLAEHINHPFSVWAGGTATLMEDFCHAECDRLYIAHDWGKAGEAARDAVAERYSGYGAEVAVMSPPPNRDWNDALVANWTPTKGQATWKET
ncbi:toprim domain-containing protein [Ruegeria sp. HKCCD7221]|uniref:toprim domain-containing protein n=1 Tax=Ruegeria sp. HKCCD7221 TaxID=2683009 RepID=UPI00148945A6|nr:toprim domain-containing protein [Ruegeria sp. HKCCD7221]